MRNLTPLAAAGIVALGAPVIGLMRLQGDDLESDAIRYIKSRPSDPISRLQEEIDSGRVHLAYDKKHGYLPAILRELRIPISSQMLVFSKTSFQRDKISPATPRALYFNEHTYVGWVQGGPVVEISTTDPVLGSNFYVLDQDPSRKPKFIRQTYECLQCHSSAMTRGVPGHIMRSVYARIDGQPEFRAGTHLTTDQSPLKERWGGWYVSGTHGSIRHMGNAIARGADEVTLDTERNANLTNLKRIVDVSPYLGQHSDIVALMVVEHQSNVLNLIARLGYQARQGLHYDAGLNRELQRPADYISDGTRSRIRGAAEDLLKAMLFVNEAPLESKVTGVSGFQETFEKMGVTDSKGRNLRTLDLERRLFRYPLSYLIYSEAATKLPDLARTMLFNRLDQILSNNGTAGVYSHLSAVDKKNIREVLLETHSEFRAHVERARTD